MSNNIMQQATGSYGMFSPQQLIDYTFTNYIMGSMSKLADKEFSISIVFTVILLLSLQELKVVAMDMLKTVSEYIKNNYKSFFKNIVGYIKSYIIPYVSPFFCFFFCCSKRKQKNKTVENNTTCIIKKENYYNVQYKLKYSMPFMQNLIKYIGDNSSSCSYIIDDNKKIEIINFEEINITEIWKDIKIRYDDININILDNLSLTFTKKQDKSFLIGVGKLKSNLDSNNIYTFSDLMPDISIKNYIKSFISVANIDKINPEYVMDMYVCNIDTKYMSQLFQFCNKIDSSHACNHFELYVILLLKTCYPNLNIITSFFEFILFKEKLNIRSLGLYSAIYEYIKTTRSINFFGNIMKLDNNNVKNIPDPNKCVTMYQNLNIHNIDALCDPCDLTKLDAYDMWFSEIKKNTHQDAESDGDLNLNITSLNNVISSQFSNLMSIINSNTRKNMDQKNKIKIFNVNVSKENVVEEFDNPVYIEYMEKYNLICNMGSVNNNENNVNKENNINNVNNMNNANRSNVDTDRSPPNNHAMNIMMQDYFSNSIPAKKIKNESIKKIISCEYINDKNKSFDTLYLREKDTRRLKFAIENFHEKAEILDVLGLPNKLGILLYGEPGTGKTSTIWAIATYLNKDIYYVNLNTIETNDELQMVFDYINKNCVNGGIITFEDIDAMTDVINKRSDSLENTENIATLMYNKKSRLTLEYFLNILQGTLTQDGTTFIVTTNHLNKLDPAFYRDGRFDVKIEMKKCDRYQIQKIYEKFIKRKLKEELLNKIPEDVYTPANIIFHLKDYILDEYSDEEIVGPLVNVHI